MEIRCASCQNEYKRMSTKELRENFLIDTLFGWGQINAVYWETDRAVVASAVPGASALVLETAPVLASDFFCERRELGVLNLGAPGNVMVDGVGYDLDHLDCLYIGRGARTISFGNGHPKKAAKFLLISYPAHCTYPTTFVKHSEANTLKLGSPETANQRTIFQYIHEGGIKSCQLVMGFTRMDTGSVWNTMPPHTHTRRSEVYVYFDIPDHAAAFHFMGPGDETRHLLVHDGQAVLSPVWSIHSGCGSQAYSFVWAMGGENQQFTDMDGIAIRDLR